MLRQGTRVNRIYILINTTNLTQPMTYIKTINMYHTFFWNVMYEYATDVLHFNHALISIHFQKTITFL